MIEGKTDKINKQQYKVGQATNDLKYAQDQLEAFDQEAQ